MREHGVERVKHQSGFIQLNLQSFVADSVCGAAKHIGRYSAVFTPGKRAQQHFSDSALTFWTQKRKLFAELFKSGAHKHSAGSVVDNVHRHTARPLKDIAAHSVKAENRYIAAQTRAQKLQKPLFGFKRYLVGHQHKNLFAAARKLLDFFMYQGGFARAARSQNKLQHIFHLKKFG